MPYAVIPHMDREAVLALADHGWGAMVATKPELGAAVALQRRLIGQVIDLSLIHI